MRDIMGKVVANHYLIEIMPDLPEQFIDGVFLANRIRAL